MKHISKKQPSDALVSFDKEVKTQYNVDVISGTDEAGRGAMAGPVVVASVILPKGYQNYEIKDSKLLNSNQREILYQEIISQAICWEVDIIDNEEVDLINPKQASRQGMVKTIEKLKTKPQLALVDAEKIVINNIEVLSLIKGDYLSQSIAAASIVAKVTRDNIMKLFHEKYPLYEFDKHKGYCTLKHQALVKELGVLPIHRKSYKPIKQILKEVSYMKFNKENEIYKSWMEHNFLDSKIKEQLTTASDEELAAAFGLELEFGTAGIRGILGAGPGRFNQYTVKKVTISYAKLLIKKYPNDLNCGVVIGHDNRHQSAEFSNLVAEILTSFGIKAYLFENNAMKPTPVVSFATKHLNCIGGIVITASHNPAQYNGYKIYDEFGCQLMPEDTDVIAAEMETIEDIIGWTYKSNDKLLETVGESAIGSYKEMVANLQFYKKSSRDNFKIVYSNVNGTGIEFAPPLLEKYGYDVIQVEEHAFEDPTFKNVGNPNPEFAPAWEIPIKYAVKHKADLIVINDPDADRIGIAIPDPKKPSEYVRLSGNETGALLINWKLSQQKLSQTIPENPALYSSFVTSDLGDRIANEEYGVKVIKTLTGFKWMGSEILKESERGLNFVFAYEESFGYVLDSSTRDKDGIQAAIMLSEATWFYKTQNKTLFDVLDEIYKKFGYYYTDTINLNFKPEEMKSKVDPIMKKLRNEPFTSLGGLVVENIEDYIDGLYNMPGQDLLKFYFDDNSWLAVRPSGTEPKIKIYYVVVDKNMSKAEAKFKKLNNELNKFLNI
ncbi:ribonuclease HII [Spiroplasma alleghenense]|uniref:Ribonuclease n=1 Tax=Spiroplasma alleghenense TaxID=216931 RepID=A0A345Z381_9MOLU|nr:ribonuclease HII [Spiroplasma alleghenense]AXK51060.1 phosphoglucomutase/phosphomannomutase [Spiroplasma alleghenense]